jgi:hypothetical protein
LHAPLGRLFFKLAVLTASAASQSSDPFTLSEGSAPNKFVTVNNHRNIIGMLVGVEFFGRSCPRRGNNCRCSIERRGLMRHAARCFFRDAFAFGFGDLVDFSPTETRPISLSDALNISR